MTDVLTTHLFVVIAPSRPKAFQNRCERHGEEHRERDRAGLHSFERLRLPERARKPVEEHGRGALGVQDERR